MINKLSTNNRVQILNALSEGIGICAASRITGKSKNTVLKPLAEEGAACALHQDRAINNLPCTLVQCDEIWCFVGTKQKKIKEGQPEVYDDCYTFTAINTDALLVVGSPSYGSGRY